MKTNGLTSRIISLLVTFVFLFTLVPTAVFADGEDVKTDYVMSLTCDNKTPINAGDTVTITVELHGPMANIGLVQYSIEFDGNYVSIPEATNSRIKAWWDVAWYSDVSLGNGLGRIAAPSSDEYNGINVGFLSQDGYYVDKDAPNGFYDASEAIAGKLRFIAKNDIKNPAEVFNLKDENCKVEHIINNERVEKTVTPVQIPDIEVANVISLIEEIGDVTLNKKDEIEAAETAYGNLSDAQKAKVTNYSKLKEARDIYDGLVAEAKAAAAKVDELIEDIGTVTLESKGAIEAAEKAYNALSDAYKEHVTLKGILDDAKVEYANIYEKAVKDAGAVDALIDAIGTVTLNSKIAIDAARGAYDALVELETGAHKFVNNLDKLIAAEIAYENLIKDKEAVDTVITAIENIGTVTIDSKGAIDNARKLYGELEDTLKPEVTNIDILEAAEAKLDSLYRVKAVKEKIAAIGEVTLASGPAIELAEEEYNSLTQEEKELVLEEYEELLKAREKYDELVADAEQDELDRAAAQGVDDMIANLGEITLESGKALEDAKNAYDNLTDAQKAYVENYDILKNAIETYDALVKEQEAIDAVDALILAIGKVTVESEEKIGAAREAYEELEDNLKERVKNYSVLENAEAIYAVIALINNIGDVSYTETCREAIEAAEEAYAALDDMLKPEMADEYTVLMEARKTYEALAPIVSESEEIEDYGNNHMLVITNVEAGRKVTVNGIEANQIVAGDKVYYVLVTAEPIEEKDIIVDEALSGDESEAQALGNINNSKENSEDTIDVLDAQLALKKAALITDAVFENDPMAYVRADVNGDGYITARDAYLIAMAILEPETADGFKIYTK